MGTGEGVVGLEGGGVKVGIPMLPMAPPPPPPLPPHPGELPKGEFPREGGTGDSGASGDKVCGEMSMRGVIGREEGGVSWFERLMEGERG